MKSKIIAVMVMELPFLKGKTWTKRKLSGIIRRPATTGIFSAFPFL